MKKVSIILLLSMLIISACSAENNNQDISEATAETIQTMETEETIEAALDPEPPEEDSSPLKISDIEEVRSICNEHLIEVHDDFEDHYMFKTGNLEDKEWLRSERPSTDTQKKECTIIPGLFIPGDCSDGEFRLLIMYHGKDWLFLNSMKIKVNDEIEEFSLPKISRDVGEGLVFESSSYRVDTKSLNLLRKAVNENNCIIRLIGKDGTYDFIFTDEQLEQLKHIVDAHDQIFKED